MGINRLHRIPPIKNKLCQKSMTSNNYLNLLFLLILNWSKKINGRNHTIRFIFPGCSNIDINLITCKDKIVITSKLQSYVVHWYHMYLLRPRTDITETIICQHLYWPDIRYAVRKEVTNCDTWQRTKRSNKKYGKLPGKLAEEIPWNTLCVDIIGPYFIIRQVKK